MAEKKIHIEGISQEITLRRNTRIKRLSIKISSSSGVVVCIPFFISEGKAIRFIISQKEWILKHLQSEKYKPKEIPSEIQLVNKRLVFEKTEHNVPSIRREKEKIVVLFPNTLNFNEISEFKKTYTEKVLREEAKQFLAQRVEEIAALHGFKYNRLSFRNQKTRWGSCSYQNDISLNIQLMRLPIHLIDYVIIHELCHTVHKNHSAQFWQLVHQKIGNSLYFCKKEMQKHNT